MASRTGVVVKVTIKGQIVLVGVMASWLWLQNYEWEEGFGRGLAWRFGFVYFGYGREDLSRIR